MSEFIQKGPNLVPEYEPLLQHVLKAYIPNDYYLRSTTSRLYNIYYDIPIIVHA